MNINVIDGWWPRLRWPYVLCGAHRARIFDCRDGTLVWEATQDGIWPAGWSLSGAVVTREVEQDVRQVALHPGRTWSEPFACPSPVVVCGDSLWIASEQGPRVGLWRGNLSGVGWECIDPTPALGASMREHDGRLAVHFHTAPGEHYEWRIVDATGQRLTTLPTANLCIPGPKLLHGVGYYGPAIVANANASADITVTPWGRESVPVLEEADGTEWAVTATAEDEMRFSSVIARPAGSDQVIQIDGFEAAYLDVQVVGRDLVIAGSNTRGQLRVERVSLDAPRAPFRGPDITDVPTEVDVEAMFLGGFEDWAAKSIGIFYDKTTGQEIRREASTMTMGRCGEWIWMTKGGQPNVLPGEVYRLHGDYLYHCQDTINDDPTPANPNGRGFAYQLRTDPSDQIGAKWLHRTLKVGQVVHAPNGQARWKKNGVWGAWEPFPYRTTVLDIWKGGPYTKVSVMYEALLGSDHEVFVGVLGNGLREWSWVQPNGVVRQRASWYEKGGRGAWPTPEMFPDAQVSEPEPEYVPVEGTIVEPSQWPVEITATIGTTVGVRCVCRVTAGVCNGVRWQRYTMGSWGSEHDWQVNDYDHTFVMFPGERETSIRCQFRDERGYIHTTGRKRKIIVRGQEPDNGGGGQEPHPGLPENPRIWRGNFLANALEPWGHMYPAWTPARREAFRKAYRAAGYTHLPIGIWGEYPRGENHFDFSANPQGYRDILIELISAGIEPCVFIVTDAVSDRSRITPANAVNFALGYLPQLRDLVRLVCLGFELNQVQGWRAEDDKRSGHHMGDLARAIKQALPDVTLYAHFQPHWWGPHYEGGDERSWYRDYPEIDGLLYQAQWDGSDEVEMDHFLYYKGASPQNPGVVGRMVTELGKQCVFFESARDLETWRRRVEIVKADGRDHGWG